MSGSFTSGSIVINRKDDIADVVAGIKRNDMEAITFKDQQILDLHKSLEQVSAALKNALDECKPLFNGERYLTDRDLSRILKISRRTLQDYRSNGIISYIMLGGKVLYRESDIQRILDNAYNKAWIE